MAFVAADRVRDTTTTTGTGVITVSGTAAQAYRTFSTVLATSDTFPYFIAHQSANEWETGVGTYSAANQITRTTVTASSNAGAAVSFSAGTKDVVLSPTSSLLAVGSDATIFRDAAGILAQRNSTNAQTFRVYNTYTDASNYERAVCDWTTAANVLTIGSQAAGGGTARMVSFVSGSVGFIFDKGLSIGGPSINGNDIRSISAFRAGTNSGNNYMATNLLGLGSSSPLAWSAGADGSLDGGNTYDTGVSRSAAGVIAIGNGTLGNVSGTIAVKTKAGAFAAGDIPPGTWCCGRDTSGATTKMYYNNAGTLQSVALT